MDKTKPITYYQDGVKELMPIKRYVCGKCNITFNPEAFGHLGNFYNIHFRDCGPQEQREYEIQYRQF